MATKTNKTRQRKKALLEALEASLGIVTVACRNAGVSRAMFYEWMNSDPEFKEAVDKLQDVVIDFAESALHKQIQAGNPTSTIFYLKTKGKKRGYIETKEIQGNISVSDFAIGDIIKEDD